MNLFEEALALLDGLEGDQGDDQRDDQGQDSDEARDLLLRLDYLRPGEGASGPALESDDPATLRNRRALLALAGHLERLFRLPSTTAPEAYFLGAEIAPARLNLPTPDGPTVSLGGRGLDFRGAFEGCLGEAAEYLSFLFWGDEPLLTAPLQAQLPADGPLKTWLLGGLGPAAGDPGQPRRWLKARSLNDGDDLPVPASLCLRGLPETGQLPAESSGCAAGRTWEEALYRALLELIERDAAALWWYGGRAAPALTLEEDEALADLLARLRPKAERPAWFLDLTSDIRIPVVAALSATPDGREVAFGLAADLNALSAAKSAALELCQMEIAQELVRLKLRQRGPAALTPVDRASLRHQQELNCDTFPNLRPGPAPHAAQRARDGASLAEVETCLERLQDRGLTAYALDLTRPKLGIPVARALVPGLQSLRVGPDGQLGWISDRLLKTSAAETKTWHYLPPLI